MSGASDFPSLPSGLASDTLAVQGGRQAYPYHALTAPVVLSAPFVFRNAEEVDAFVQAKRQGQTPFREYGRYGNPTVEAAERHLATLEGAEAALLFASGMSAITTALLVLLPPGSHLVLTQDMYRRTREFVGTWLPRLGVRHTIVPPGDHEALRTALRPETRLLFSEVPTNPYLRVPDLERMVALARRQGALVAVDATLASPVNLRPLDFGVDLVFHSATKYLGGHHDLLAGVVAGHGELIQRLREAMGVLGGVCAPQTAFLLIRGLKTLGLRVAQHNRNGQAVAAFLEGHPAVERVWYPGLPSHPDHVVARRQMKGFGGVVSFVLKGGLDAARQLLDALRIPLLGPSLGGVESLVMLPALMSYTNLSAEQRAALGIPDGLVRLALGIEDTEDLLQDLAEALAQVGV